MVGVVRSGSDGTGRGLLGDRAIASVTPNHVVVSATNPKRWPRMFDFGAALDTFAELGALSHAFG